VEKLFIPPANVTPEISLDPESWILSIKGVSAPEDVRGVYYPVVEWITSMADQLTDNPSLADNDGVKLTIDLKYFNSSSGKFLYDIMQDIGRISKSGIKTEVIWVYDPEDIDMKEVGQDLAAMAGISFTFLAK
jgi:hypothetical protein